MPNWCDDGTRHPAAYMPRLCGRRLIRIESLCHPGQIEPSARCPFGGGTNMGTGRMLDAIFIAAGLAFFVVATAYAYACDRL